MYDTAFNFVDKCGNEYDTAEDYKYDFDKYNVFDKLDIINENIIRINEAINKLNENVEKLSEAIKTFGDEYDGVEASFADNDFTYDKENTK